MDNHGEMLIYQTEDGLTKIDVNMYDETVWLCLAQMSDLFARDKSTISRHIKNIFEEGELSGGAYRFFFGGSTSGKAVTERSYMQMTAVYSCERIRSEAVAGLPLHLYQYNDSGGKEKALGHPLYFFTP